MANFLQAVSNAPATPDAPLTTKDSAQPTNSDAAGGCEAEAARLELSNLQLSELIKRASVAGVDTIALAEAHDFASPKDRIVELLLPTQSDSDQNADASVAGPALVSGLEASLRDCVALLDRHISQTLRMRRAEVAEAAQMMSDQLQVAEVATALLCHLKSPSLLRAKDLLSQHDSLPEGTPSTVDDVAEACQLLENLLLSDEKQMLTHLRSASCTVVADTFSQVVCPLLDGGRIDGVPRKQQNRGAEAAEDLLPTLQNGIIHTLPESALKHLAGLLVDVRKINLEAATVQDFKIAEELILCIRAVATPPVAPQSKLSYETATKAHHGGHVKAGPVDSASAHHHRVPLRAASTPALRVEPVGDASGHCMLSYQWDWQNEVTRVCAELNERGIRTWLDIDGGIGPDLYEGMADGVEGATCVCAFIAPSYADSENCKLGATLRQS